MNLLDENVGEDQRSLLRVWRLAVLQVGSDVGRKGMKDEEIISLLHGIGDVTFFTRDRGFAEPKLCHPCDCLVCLDVKKDEVAIFVRRVLRHPELNTKAKRMGAIVRASHIGLSVWRRNAPKERCVRW